MLLVNDINNIKPLEIINVTSSNRKVIYSYVQVSPAVSDFTLLSTYYVLL